MNKSLFAVALASLCVMACQPGQKKNLEFHIMPGEIIDLGSINEEDGIIEMDVYVLNTSNDTITPVRKRVSCTCLSTKIGMPTVAPGEEHKMHFTYDPSYRMGRQQETSYVYYDNKKMTKVDIVCDVKPCLHPIEESTPYEMGLGFRTNFKVVSFSNMKRGESKEITLKIGNQSEKKSRIELRTDDPRAEWISMRQPGKMKADGRDTIHVRFNMPVDAELHDTILVNYQPYVNGVPTEEQLTVRAIVSE